MISEGVDCNFMRVSDYTIHLEFADKDTPCVHFDVYKLSFELKNLLKKQNGTRIQ